LYRYSTAAELKGKPGASFVTPERSVLGKPGFGPGAMAGDAEHLGGHHHSHHHSHTHSHAHGPRRGGLGLLPSLAEEGASSSSSSSSASASAAAAARDRDFRGSSEGLGARASSSGKKAAEAAAEDPSAVIASATAAMVDAAMASAARVDAEAAALGSPSAGGLAGIAESPPSRGGKSPGALGGGGKNIAGAKSPAAKALEVGACTS
jgi:hypothetical protein